MCGRLLCSRRFAELCHVLLVMAEQVYAQTNHSLLKQFILGFLFVFVWSSLTVYSRTVYSRTSRNCTDYCRVKHNLPCNNSPMESRRVRNKWWGIVVFKTPRTAKKGQCFFLVWLGGQMEQHCQCFTWWNISAWNAGGIFSTRMDWNSWTPCIFIIPADPSCGVNESFIQYLL